MDKNFTTLHVRKRNTSLEPFNPVKLQRVAIAAGLSKEDALRLSQLITEDIIALHKRSISHAKIREFMIRELTKIDRYAANMYEWYEKTKHRDEKLQRKRS
jgi:2-phosphoglycerate kinase